MSDESKVFKKIFRNNEKIRQLQQQNAELEESLNKENNDFQQWVGKVVTIRGDLAMSLSYKMFAFYGEIKSGKISNGQAIVTFKFITIFKQSDYTSYCHNEFGICTVYNYTLAWKYDEYFQVEEIDDSVFDKAFERASTISTLDIIRLIKKSKNTNVKEGCSDCKYASDGICTSEECVRTK